MPPRTPLGTRRALWSVEKTTLARQLAQHETLIAALREDVARLRHERDLAQTQVRTLQEALADARQERDEAQHQRDVWQKGASTIAADAGRAGRAQQEHSVYVRAFRHLIARECVHLSLGTSAMTDAFRSVLLRTE